MIGQNAGGKTLILQASSLAVSDTLFDSSQAQRLQNQPVYAAVVCRLRLYRSFLSLCYWRSMDKMNDRWGELVMTPVLIMGMEAMSFDRLSFGGVKEFEEMYFDCVLCEGEQGATLLVP